jgi:hypothetical protein
MPKEPRMTTRRFLLTAGIGLLAAALALTLAEILDAPWLRRRTGGPLLSRPEGRARQRP